MATHWLDSATIDGFRNLRDLHLEGLGGINVLVGENNSGKTSVLEALSILANHDDPTEWMKVVERRDFGRLDETRVKSIQWCFHQLQTNECADLASIAKCSMMWTGRLGDSEVTVTCEDIDATGPYHRNGTIEATLFASEVKGVRLAFARRPSIDRRGSTRIESDSPAEYFVWEDDSRPFSQSRARIVETAFLNPHSHLINRLPVIRLSEGKLRHEDAALLDLLRGFDADIREVLVVSLRGTRPTIYIDHERTGKAPLSVFGDAIRRAVLLASTILSFENGGILFLDEVETGIHVKAIRRVFTWLAKVAVERNVQVFATTHSLEAVDAIAFSSPQAKEEVVAYRLDQTPEQTNAKRFDGDLLGRLRRERGLDVR